MEKKTYPTNHRSVNVSYDAFDKLQQLVIKLNDTKHIKMKYGALVTYLIEKELAAMN